MLGFRESVDSPKPIAYFENRKAVSGLQNPKPPEPLKPHMDIYLIIVITLLVIMFLDKN